MILVVGATGVLGTEICQRLTEAGKPVRALVRRKSAEEKKAVLEQMGVALAEGDLKDPASLDRACQGVKSVISTATTVRSRQEGDSFEATDRDGNIALIDAAKKKDVRRFVFISFPPMPFEFPLQDAKRAVENKLRSNGLKYTVLQPTYFQEVWLSPHLGFDPERGSIRIFGNGKNKFSWISYHDVARFTAATLDDRGSENAIIPLGGPHDLSPEEVVSIFERASGKKMNVEYVPDDTLLSQYQAATDPVQKTFAGLMLGYTKTQPIDMSAILQRMPIKLQSVEDYARTMFKSASA